MVQAEEIESEEVGENIRAVEATKLEDLLSAIYLRRREIPSFQRLSDLVEMGDFYCALPAVSIFVEANLHNSPGLLRDISHMPSDMLGEATKLRSRTLFREAFIHIVGQWSEEMQRAWGPPNLGVDLEDNARRELEDLVELYYGRLCAKLVTANSFLLNCCVKEPRVWVGKQERKEWQIRNDLEDLRWEIIRGELQFQQGTFSEASFSAYERLYNASFMPTPEQTERYRVLRGKGKYGTAHLAQELGREVADLVRDKLGPLMQNFLQLNNSVGGDKASYNYFLCTNLADEDLPWNGDELEW